MSRVRAAMAAVLAALLAGCASLPPNSDRPPSQAYTDTAATRLGRTASAVLAGARPGQSGIHALFEPRDAFVARVALAATAERSLDVQYYIWHGDQVGYLLFEALWNAAERGVRVRLLLDDANTTGLDPTLAVLDAHPNIEVRLYNPFASRGSRALGFLGDFERLNRRMHNKSFTADNQVTVVGGRNVGNEYYGAGEGVEFADLDVLAVGPAVGEVSSQFDLYWSSASAYPAAALIGPPPADGVAMLQRKFAETRADPLAVEYLEALARSPLVAQLRTSGPPLEFATAHVVNDDPAKTLDADAPNDVLLFPELIKRLGRPEEALDIVSPYFVPGDAGTQALVELARRGVKVRILTNSLAASDVGAVHAGYEKRRRDLLQGGVVLYELKPTALDRSKKDRDKDDGKVGSSGSAGLHAKTYAVDRARVFVGSFNFDPRSARLNTELGLVIDSPVLAGRLAMTFDKIVPQVAYEVRLTPDGSDLQWIERTASGEELRHDTEPETGVLKRWGVKLMSILPIEWLL
jgi:putative cardiolipin synthase